MAEEFLQVEKLNYCYGKRHVVKDVSFTVRRSEVFGLLGPNGAGKTTTISCIAGLLREWTGSLLFRGQPFAPATRVSDRQKLGFVPQELAIYPNLSAQENLAFFAKISGVASRERQGVIDRNLELSGLTERRKDLVGTFSGGMQRRLNLACGLVHSPPLLLMDEPTVGVDPQSRNHIFETLIRLRSEGHSIIYTTHYMEEAQRLCDRIAVMHEGTIIAMGTHAELAARVGDADANLEQVFFAFDRSELARRMNILSAAWVLAIKDLRGFVRDRSALMLSVLVPIALVTVFGWIMAYAFGGSGGMPKVTLHVVDDAKSDVSERMVSRLEKHEMLRVKRVKVPEGESQQTAAELAEKLVRDGDANHVLILRPASGESSSEVVERSLIRDPGRAMEDRIIQFVLMQVTVQEQGPVVLTDGMERLLAKRGMAAENIQSIRGWMGDIEQTIDRFESESSEADALKPPANAEATKEKSDERVEEKATEEATEDDGEFDLNGVLEFARELVPLETIDVQPPGESNK